MDGLFPALDFWTELQRRRNDDLVEGIFQFDPFREAASDVIERERALGVARDLDSLPGG